MRKTELATPCLVLEVALLERNLATMQAAATRAGKRLRPHAKTHKCSALARRQLAAGARGVCVAKVAEAAGLVAAGLSDVLVTGPVVAPARIERLVALLAAAPDLLAVVDCAEAVVRLDAALRAAGRTLGVLLDVDVGLHRTGVAPAVAPALAAAVRACPTLRLRGVQAYAGHVQHLRDYAARRDASRACLAAAVPVFRVLHAADPACDIFSTTGTGTFDIDLAVPEVTELQVGSYVCMDAEYRGIGSAADATQNTTFAPALRLLTTVVSANQPGFVTVDAGLKALYRDGGKPLVYDAAAGTPTVGLAYDWFGDEYGRLTAAPGTPAPRLGDVLELIPAHCDPTINLFDRFHLCRGDDVVGEWPIDLRGCSQ